MIGFEICERHGRIRCCECAEIDDLRQRLAAAEALIQAAIAYRAKWNAKEAGLWECHLALLRTTAEYEAAKGGRDE